MLSAMGIASLVSDICCKASCTRVQLLHQAEGFCQQVCLRAVDYFMTSSNVLILNHGSWHAFGLAMMHLVATCRIDNAPGLTSWW